MGNSIIGRGLVSLRMVERKLRNSETANTDCLLCALHSKCSHLNLTTIFLVVILLSAFYKGEMGGQRGKAACLKPHCEELEEQGFQLSLAPEPMFSVAILSLCLHSKRKMIKLQ